MVSSDCRYASRSSSGVKSSSSEAGNPSEFDRSYQIPSFLPPLHPPQSQPPARPPHPLTAMWSAPTGIDSVRRPKKGRSNSVLEFASAVGSPLHGTFLPAGGGESVAQEVANEPLSNKGNGVQHDNPASTVSSEICYPSRNSGRTDAFDKRETGAPGRLSVMVSGKPLLNSSVNTHIQHSNVITRATTPTGEEGGADLTSPASKQREKDASPALSSCRVAGSAPSCTPPDSSHCSSFEKLPSRPLSPRSQASMESCVSAGSGSMTLIEGSIVLQDGKNIPLLMAADEQCHEVAERWVDKHWRALQSLWITTSSALIRNGGSKGSGDICRLDETQEETPNIGGSSNECTFLRRELAIKMLTTYLKEVEEQAEVLPTSFNEKWLTILKGR
eukprot:GHVS01036975.1.p1 GENE.GHVS01036975.1~~GHVS01036975.1.p1  ORF type:complete len:388 (+),score=50.79 GHVS01036975.1:1139-2302(+)